MLEIMRTGDGAGNISAGKATKSGADKSGRKTNIKNTGNLIIPGISRVIEQHVVRLEVLTAVLLTARCLLGCDAVPLTISWCYEGMYFSHIHFCLQY